MERDFLGAMLKGPRECSEEDSVHLGGSGVHWSLSTNLPALPPSMASKSARKYKPKRVTVGQFSSSNSQPRRTTKNFRSKQKSSFFDFFNLERQGPDQYSMDFDPSQVTNTSAFSMHRQFLSQCFCTDCYVQAATDSQISSQDSGTTCPKPPTTDLEQQQNFGGKISVSAASVDLTDKASFPLNPLKSHESGSQLTLFYRGAVIVCEDVRFDKVQEMMSLARCRPLKISDFTDSKSEMPALEPINMSDTLEISMTQSESQGQGVSNCSGSPISLSSITGKSGSGDDTVVPKHTETSPVPLRSVHMDSSYSIIPRAVPQARKASLTRFLEKRNARMINFMPYSYDKISLESTVCQLK